MKRESVQSSSIASIGYDEASQTLEIEFLNGAVYQYFDVPMQIYQEFLAASSKGEYLTQFIKGYYRYSKV